jgi:hypothetical protein
MIAFLQSQLQQSRDAERELRLLLAQAVKTNQLLATPLALPPAPEPDPPAARVPEPVTPRKVRWYWPFGRRP